MKSFPPNLFGAWYVAVMPAFLIEVSAVFLKLESIVPGTPHDQIGLESGPALNPHRQLYWFLLISMRLPLVSQSFLSPIVMLDAGPPLLGILIDVVAAGLLLKFIFSVNFTASSSIIPALCPWRGIVLVPPIQHVPLHSTLEEEVSRTGWIFCASDFGISSLAL